MKSLLLLLAIGVIAIATPSAFATHDTWTIDLVNGTQYYAESGFAFNYENTGSATQNLQFTFDSSDSSVRDITISQNLLSGQHSLRFGSLYTNTGDLILKVTDIVTDHTRTFLLDILSGYQPRLTVIYPNSETYPISNGVTFMASFRLNDGTTTTDANNFYWSYDNSLGDVSSNERNNNYLEYPLYSGVYNGSVTYLDTEYDYTETFTFTMTGDDSDTCPESISDPPPGNGGDSNVEKKSGGGCADCFAPTMGISNKDGKTYVDNGLILNGQPLQVDLFYTHMPMQYTEIGKMNNVTMTWYENNGASNIDTVQLVLGLEKIGSSLNSGQATIGIEMGHFANNVGNPIMDNMVITDPDKIIDVSYASVKLADCGAVDDDCLQVQILWKYLKVPDYAVLGANAWDFKRNSFDNTFNDGLTVIDPNYVEPTPAEPYKYTCDDPLPETLMNGGDRNNCHWREQLSNWK